MFVLNFFDFNRQASGLLDLSVFAGRASMADFVFMEEALHMRAGSELRLYLMKFGKISQGWANFLSADEIACETARFHELYGFAGRFFVVEIRDDNSYILVDCFDQVWRFHASNHSSDLTALRLDLFAYILVRLREEPEIL